MYKLDANGIAAAIQEIEDFLKDNRVEKKEVLRICLGAEEILLRYKDELGEKTDFYVNTYKRFGKLKIRLAVDGHMYDPLRKSGSTEANSSFMRAVLSNMGELPVWRYAHDENIVTYNIAKKHLSSWVHLIIGIVLAVLVALILSLFPENITNVVHTEFLTPVLDTFMNLLSAIAGPMIFLAVVWGIYSIGDVSAFSVMGKKLLGRFFLFITIITIVFGFAVIPLFTFGNGEALVGNSFSDIFKMILNIVPGNIFLPFTEGNTLQILFLAIVMGIAMIMIGERTQTVAIFAEQLNYIVQIIMEFISKLVPIFVFGSVLDILLSNQFSDIELAYKLFLVNVIACLLLVIAYLVILRVKMRANPFRILKKSFKTFLIGLTTASSAAAFSANLETCKEGYGIDEGLVDFGIPFAQVIYKPTVAILFFTSAIYTAECYAVPVSISWIITAIVMSVLLSVATPPIPGGSIASISVIFAQLALPDKGIAIVLALNIILDFVETPTDLFGGQTMLILAANKFRQIKKDVLRN